MDNTLYIQKLESENETLKKKLTDAYEKLNELESINQILNDRVAIHSLSNIKYKGWVPWSVYYHNASMMVIEIHKKTFLFGELIKKFKIHKSNHRVFLNFPSETNIYGDTLCGPIISMCEYNDLLILTDMDGIQFGKVQVTDPHHNKYKRKYLKDGFVHYVN